MKKCTLYSFIALLSVFYAGYAEEEAPDQRLATKNYVDSGLIAVYNKANDKITTLQQQVEELASNDDTYSGGEGIEISNAGEVGLKFLPDTEQIEDTMYVYKNGSFVPLETATSEDWNE